MCVSISAVTLSLDTNFVYKICLKIKNAFIHAHSSNLGHTDQTGGGEGREKKEEMKILLFWVKKTSLVICVQQTL